MLDEAVGLDQLLEVVAGDEVVLAAVLLAGARAAGRVRDAEAVAVGVLGEEALEEGGLAGARGAGDDDGAGVEVWWRRVSVYGMGVRMGFMFIYRWEPLWLLVGDEGW